VPARPAPILRCSGPLVALRSLAALFAVSAGRLAAALPGAAKTALADTHAPYPAHMIVPALVADFGRRAATPSRIHYFHGTRTFDPQQFWQRGLLPLTAVLGDLWERLQRLAPEIEPARFAELRWAIENGEVDALNYKARVDIGAKDDGPHGVLVRGVLLDPEAFHSSPFLRIPETVENIIFAASDELQIDLEPRYEEATTSCVVEFAAPPDDFDQALAAACWYVEAAIRGDAAGPDVHWNFSGDGTAVPPQDIVFVDILEPAQ
jgi:hypothetical protein